MLTWIPTCWGSLYFQTYTDRTCTVPLSVPLFPFISLPSLSLTYSQSSCIPSTGVSGLPGVQWLRYFCPPNQVQSLYVYEYDYSTPVNSSCPTNTGYTSNSYNWSMFFSGGGGNPIPTCRQFTLSIYNVTTNTFVTTYQWANFSCSPATTSNQAVGVRMTGRTVVLVLLLVVLTTFGVMISAL
jgi:hypothetical protein